MIMKWEPNTRTERTTNMIKFIIKTSLAGALIWWLINTGKLNFAALEPLWGNPRIAFLNILFWLSGAVILCSARWRSLVHGIGFTLSFFHTVRLNLIGLFFNAVMPGVVGGDVVKAIYVCKKQPGQARVPVLLTILLDRVVGLLALFFISFCAVLLNWKLVFGIPVMRPFVLLTLSVIAGVSLLGLMVVVPSHVRERFFLIRWIFMVINKIRFLRKVYEALRCYKDKPAYVLRAFCFGVLHQLLFVGLYLTISNTLISQSAHWGLLLTILPLGIVSTALPLTPGGVGIGHIAFDRLYSLIGLSGGANVFNIVFFGQLALNLSGFIPYLFIRSELAPLIRESEEDAPSPELHNTLSSRNCP